MSSSSPASAHGPNRFQNFMNTHDTVMRQFMDRGFIGRDTLIVTRFPRFFLMEGQIGCSGLIVIDVRKRMSVVEDGSDPLVQTTSYSYNVSVFGRGNLFRYDSPHLDHNRDHHRHEYTYPTGEERADSPRMSAGAGWPTLGQVIAEAEDWYWVHHDRLLPGYPVLPSRA